MTRNCESNLPPQYERMTIEHVDQSESGRRAAISLMEVDQNKAIADAITGVLSLFSGGTFVPEYWRAYADTVLTILEDRQRCTAHRTLGLPRGDHHDTLSSEVR